MSGMHAATGPTIGDLRATVRLLQRRLNIIEHLCDEAETVRREIPTPLLRAALESGRK